MPHRRRSLVPWAAALLLAVGWRSAPAQQGIPIEANPPGSPDAAGSILGASPGAGSNSLGEAPGESGLPLLARPGQARGIVPSSIARPPGPLMPEAPSGIVLPDALPRRRRELPQAAALALPEVAGGEGPASGMSLDQAIERLVVANLDLKNQAYELPQAEADVLTAGLRANPVVFADTILVPYGNFSPRRPGGQTQYDVAVTWPFDVTHKRQARQVVARKAKRVLEAQYQDAVRIQIDNLYTVFVDALEARETAALAQASVEGLRALRKSTENLVRAGEKTQADVNIIEIQLNVAELGLRDAQMAVRRSKQGLGALLNTPPAEVDALEIRGAIRLLQPLPPPDPELVPIALECRPDIQAYRLGISRAESDVNLARANRYTDVYLTYTPYTFQNNAPFGTKSATSWDVSVAAAVPLFNRNQGNLTRARLNVDQTRTGLAALERRVVADVFRADQEYDITRAAVEEIERDLLPAARQVLENSRRLYLGGETALLDYLAAQRNYNDVVRQYRDNLVRHRRSMLDLNTALGRRVLP